MIFFLALMSASFIEFPTIESTLENQVIKEPTSRTTSCMQKFITLHCVKRLTDMELFSYYGNCYLVAVT